MSPRSAPTRTSSASGTRPLRSRCASITWSSVRPPEGGHYVRFENSEFDDGLPHVESLRVSGARSALHAPETHESHEGFPGEPVLVALGAEGIVEKLHLLLANRLVEGHEAVRRPEIAVELGDLVFENQVIPERVPRQIRQDAVILMAVVPIVGEDDIGRCRLQRLEDPLDLLIVRKEAVPEMLDDDA